MEKLIGNALVGQSGGPTAAINATLCGVIEGCLSPEAQGTIERLYGMRNGVEGLLREELVDLTQRFATAPQDLLRLRHTPASALGSCRKKLLTPAEDGALYQRIEQIFRRYNIRYFFYIGGNDSMDAVAKLRAYFSTAAYEVRVIGVPKTIDNDLVMTDHTPGFGSAAKYIAVTTQEILRDCAVYTVPAVTVVEIMGRDAGWLTAAAALPGAVNGEGVDLIYLPERPFSYEFFFSDVQAALARHPNVVVAVSEGLRTADGTYVGAGMQSGVTDTFGHQYLAGTGKALEYAVKKTFGCKVRSIELNLPQRCAAHLASETDLSESVATGRHAVRVALAGENGCMVTITRGAGEGYSVSFGTAPVSAIANQVRVVPDAYIQTSGNGITEAGIAYLRPLIIGEAQLEYQNGLPVHCIL